MGTCTHWLLGLRLFAYIVMRSIYIKDLLAEPAVEWLAVTLNMLAILAYLSTAIFYFLATVRPDIYYAYNPRLIALVLTCFIAMDVFSVAGVACDDVFENAAKLCLHLMEACLEGFLLAAFLARSGREKWKRALVLVMLPFYREVL